MKVMFYIILSILLKNINLAVPFMNIILDNDELTTKTIYIYGHINPDTDAILSPIILRDFLIKVGNPNNLIACRLGEMNKETKFALNYFKQDAPILISDLAGADEVILVDHNSPSQSLDFKHAKVIWLIDHHAMTGFETTEPITIITKPVGCTSTILFQLYTQNNVTISKDIAGLIISAIISDTLLLKSPITTDEDIEAVEYLSDYIGLNYTKFGYDLLEAGTDVSDLSEYDIINLDSKSYKVNGYMIDIAFVNSLDPLKVLERKEKLLEEINKFIEKNNMKLFVLVIVDIKQMDSYALVSGSLSKVVETAFGVEIKDNVIFLKGISSRKKEVYPNIANAINELPEYIPDYVPDNSYSNYINLSVLLLLSLISLI